jgi:hypothetical protein
MATKPPDERISALRWWLVAALTVGIWLAPWLYRNHAAMGFVFIRSNFGLEFAMSNHQDSKATWLDNYQRIPHPSTHLEDAQLIARIGEPAYNRMRLLEAFAWIREDPAAFLGLSAKRALYFWFQPRRSLIASLLASGMTLAALCGLYVLFQRRRRTIAWLFLLAWLSFSCVYYLIQFGARYRYPIDWSLLLLAAVWLHSLWHSSRLAPLRARIGG